MATNLEQFFDALMEQTRTRGGYPGTRSINDTALAIQAFIAAYSQVREAATQAVFPTHALVDAIKSADAALAMLEGRDNVGDESHHSNLNGGSL